MQSLFGEGKAFIGVIHLSPLPGSPRWGGDLSAVLAQAEREAATLAQGGARGIIVENFGDAPFRIGRVEPETVAAMTRAVDLVCRTTPLPVGVNMLRTDALSALAVAVAGGARFIRVNVHYGTMAADEGLVTGEASETLRRRRLMDADHIAILADVLVKHAVPLGEPESGPDCPGDGIPGPGRRAHSNGAGDRAARRRRRRDHRAPCRPRPPPPGRQRRRRQKRRQLPAPRRRRHRGHQPEEGRRNHQPHRFGAGKRQRPRRLRKRGKKVVGRPAWALGVV